MNQTRHTSALPIPTSIIIIIVVSCAIDRFQGVGQGRGGGGDVSVQSNPAYPASRFACEPPRVISSFEFKLN